jgi:hypothetical protein
MSTVPEVIVASHMGIKVTGISCITNLAAGIGQKKLSHDEVGKAAELVRLTFTGLLGRFLDGPLGVRVTPAMWRRPRRLCPPCNWNIPALHLRWHISPILVGEGRRVRSSTAATEISSPPTPGPHARPRSRRGTAGPGVTNALTALKNAQLAQSPGVLFGGATATVLKGRGALQDIDQMALIRSAVKWAARCRTVSQLGPTVERALREASEGVPGPVFVEVPVDVLYPETIVKEWYLKESGVEKGRTLGEKALGYYLKGHLYRQFHAPHVDVAGGVASVMPSRNRDLDRGLDQAVELLRNAERPALVIGSQTMVNCRDAGPIAQAVEALGIPVWLGGMARGLLGRSSPLQFRHARGKRSGGRRGGGVQLPVRLPAQTAWASRGGESSP